MIVRANWLDVKKYVRYLERVRQLTDGSIKAAESHLRRLLRWADDTPFPRARTIDPTFPAYLLHEGGVDKRSLAPSTMERACVVAKEFFRWARREYPLKYRPLTEHWIETIRPPRSHREQSRLKKRELYHLEEVREIVSLTPRTMTERRDIAATAFMYISGIRIGAFVSLRFDCIDLEHGAVSQLPELGVMTKNSKAAITYLLDIPDLVDVVRAWDEEIRPLVPARGLWYVPLASDRSGILGDGTTDSRNRDQMYRRGLRVLCERAGVPYKSPHKLRHGNAVYGIKHAESIEDLKALSQNLMHSTIGITDGLYGNLENEDVRAAIAKIGSKKNGKNNGSSNDLGVLLEQLGELKKQHPDLIRALLENI